MTFRNQRLPGSRLRVLIWFGLIGGLALVAAGPKSTPGHNDPSSSPPQVRPACDLLLVGG